MAYERRYCICISAKKLQIRMGNRSFKLTCLTILGMHPTFHNGGVFCENMFLISCMSLMLLCSHVYKLHILLLAQFCGSIYVRTVHTVRLVWVFYTQCTMSAYVSLTFIFAICIFVTVYFDYTQVEAIHLHNRIMIIKNCLCK